MSDNVFVYDFKSTDHPNTAADIFIAICYGLCFLTGISGNIVSLRYFLSEPRTLSILLYRVIAMNDILISIFALPVMFAIATRSPMMFSSEFICTVWGILSKGFVYISVFLVCVMSISRTYSLVFPFRRINNKKVMIGVVCYLTFVILYRCSLLPSFTFVFTREDCYCWGSKRYNEIWGIDYAILQLLTEVIEITMLIVPVLPISISCLISSFLLNRDIKLGNAENQSSKAKQKATKTIIIFTLLYIVCNVPVLVMYIYYLLCFNTYPEPYFTSSFMYLYSWNVFVVLSVCINSACNPIIYMTRNKMFKSHVRKKINVMMSKIKQGGEKRMYFNDSMSDSNHDVRNNDIRPYLLIKVITRT